jgi:hypothetical protein
MVNGLQTLVRHGRLTLVELPVLLTNPQFRRQVLAKVGHDDLGVGPFWHYFESLSDGERATIIGPSLNKLRAFTNREITRRVIGQAQGFDLRTVFTERKVLLVNLSKGRLGSESGQLLGSLIVGSLWATIQQRAQLRAERRHPVFVYLDEFQELLRLPTDFADALAQARGLGVGLIMAHQNLDQLSPSMQSAVMANARTKLVFACGHDDARQLAKVLGSGLTPDDVQGLGVYETYQAHCVGVSRRLLPALELDRCHPQRAASAKSGVVVLSATAKPGARSMTGFVLAVGSLLRRPLLGVGSVEASHETATARRADRSSVFVAFYLVSCPACAASANDSLRY